MATQFGVSTEQVERDHLISHVKHPPRRSANIEWAGRAHPIALRSGQSGLAVRATDDRSALRRRPCDRAARSDTARVCRVKDVDVGRPERCSRPLGPVGAERIGRNLPESRAPLPPLGPTNHPPASRLFTSAPTDAVWQSQLAVQTRITISARQALDAVREAWHAVATPISDE